MVHRRVDGWLLGGVAVASWVAVGPFGFVRGAPTGVLLGAVLTIAAMHFGASYHLAYGDGIASVRRHPYALLGVPIALAVAAAVVVAGASSGAGWAKPTLRALLVSVFTLTAWHYVKQAFGVGMLVARSHGLRPSKRQVLILRYGLYPLWVFNALLMWERGRGATYFGYDLTYNVLPPSVEPALLVLAAAVLAVCLLTVIELSWRARRFPPLGLWGTYVAAGLWFLVRPNYVSATVVFAGLHGLQYLVCAHRAEVDLAVERHEPNLLHRWLCVFGGAAAGGLLLSSWLPQATDKLAFGALPVLVPALIFVALNLHHYAIDAVIWRSGGEHVVRISKGPRVEADVAAKMEGASPTDAPPVFV
jgi:hypothetical protein